LAPGVRLVPERVCVKGQLVNTLLRQPVSGFDLSPVNRYKWHPTVEQIDTERWEFGATRLAGSAPRPNAGGRSYRLPPWHVVSS
jgi:hypothetical protein